MRYIRYPLPEDRARWTGRQRTVIVGRRSFSWQRFPARWPFKRYSGGEATPGPWVSWYLPGLGCFTVARDRTLFGLG